jgi:putative oxidoreductase
MTYIDHLSATRTIISRARQFAAVCSTSGGMGGAGGAIAARRRDAPGAATVLGERVLVARALIGAVDVFVRMGYSEVTGAPSRAFFNGPPVPCTLRSVTNRNLGRNGNQDRSRAVPGRTRQMERHTMDATYGADPRMLGIGLLIARLALGMLMAAHGTQKLFGWFGGLGLRSTGELFDQLGFRPGRLFAAAASAGEVASGLLVTLGFLGPIGPALMVSVMVVAALSVHWTHGLFATSNGIELPLLYAAGALGLALAGPGPYSLDAALGIGSVWSPSATWTILVLGVVGGVANLGARRRPVSSVRG